MEVIRLKGHAYEQKLYHRLVLTSIDMYPKFELGDINYKFSYKINATQLFVREKYYEEIDLDLLKNLLDNFKTEILKKKIRELSIDNFVTGPNVNLWDDIVELIENTFRFTPVTIYIYEN